MAKFAEHHYSYKTASMQHQRAMFWVFSDQQSISLSVKSIDSSHRYFLSRQQPRFLQETLQLHQRCCFQQQALSGIESISGFFHHFRFLYKCSHLIKCLLTELGRSVRRIFCPLSLHRPRRSASVYTKTSVKISLCTDWPSSVNKNIK